MGILDAIIGGGVGKLVKDVVGTFKLSPEAKLEFEREMAAHEAEIRLKEMEIDAKLADSAGQNLRAELASNSWMGRNWRPFFGFGMGSALIANIVIPLVSTLTGNSIPMLEIPAEYFLLFGFGFLGYGGLRTYEKIMEARFGILKK